MATSKFLKGLKKGILTPHLENYFASSKEGREEIQIAFSMHKEHDDAFHPSSDPLTCSAALWAARQGHDMSDPRMADPEMQKTFAVGHMWHGLIYHLLVAELGFTDWEHVEQEVIMHRNDSSGHDALGIQFGFPNIDPMDVAPGPHDLWWARGHIDCSQVHIPGKGTYLVDIKTQNSRSFAAPTPPDYLWLKYQAQMHVYLDWVNLDKCIMLFINKDAPHSFKEIVIERDPEVAQLVYEKWDSVAEALRDGSPPEHTCPDPTKCVAQGIRGTSKEAVAP